jgi:hypothetical protein
MPLLPCPWTRQKLRDVPVNTDFLCNKAAVITEEEEEHTIQVYLRRYFSHNLASYCLWRNFLLSTFVDISKYFM